MAVTADSFIVRFPQFEGEDSARLTQLITEAQLFVGSAAKWGALYDSAVNFVAAHHLARSNESAASENGKSKGAITRLDIDDQVSVSYAQPQQRNDPGQDSEYSSTIYGQQYLSLRRSVIGTYRIGIH